MSLTKFLQVDPEHGGEWVEAMDHFLNVYDASNETFETMVNSR
jgi:hypothetical protein